MIRAFIVGLTLSIGACGVFGGPICGPGEQAVVNPWASGGTQCVKAAAGDPRDSCFGLGCVEAIPVDAGIELADGGGACTPVAEDDVCLACVKQACCALNLACFARADGGVCSPTDEVGAPLAGCIADNCAAACPGVP